MSPELEQLRALIDGAPGVAAQLRLAHEASHDGRHREALVHCSIAADALVLAYPERLTDAVQLNRALRRLFLES